VTTGPTTCSLKCFLGGRRPSSWTTSGRHIGASGQVCSEQHPASRPLERQCSLVLSFFGGINFLNPQLGR
jgi:hypothetical protein